ncbi:hypothetical protein EMIT07CA2_50333 [Brevibacillus sp. IT-7CA2]
MESGAGSGKFTGLRLSEAMREQLQSGQEDRKSEHVKREFSIILINFIGFSDFI